MRAIEIIGVLRERYSHKYARTPNKDKAHYIQWLQDEYAELVIKQANDAIHRTCDNCKQLNMRVGRHTTEHDRYYFDNLA